MKCQDILQNELHEKYIFDQLEGSEKENYDLHLKECKDCQAELENQRTLISGIREAGLAEMKNEIKRQVEIGELNHPGMTWGRLSKIAAVLFIFVLTPGVIIYLSKSNPELVPTAQQKTPNAQVNIPYSAADAATERRLNIMSTEMMDADSKVLKIPKQKDAGGNKIFKKNESLKLDALKLTFEETKKAKITTEIDTQEISIRAEPAQSQISLKEEVSTFKDETELEQQNARQDTLYSVADVVIEGKRYTPKFKASSAVSKPDLAATPQELQSTGNLGDLNEPQSEVTAFSSTKYRGVRTYVYQVSEASLKKTRKSRQRKTVILGMKSKEKAVSDLRFISNGNAILVHLRKSEDEATREVLVGTIAVRLPKSFAVEIITQDSLNLEMNWLVGSEFLKVKPEGIEIEISNKRVMRVLIEDQFIYETDLSKNSTKAILLRNLIDKKPIYP